MKLLDSFGVILPIKQVLAQLAGWYTVVGLRVLNRFSVEGRDNLEKLPRKNILFIANHRTYYMEGIALYHVVGWCFRRWSYLVTPPSPNYYFVAAKETMYQSGMLPRILAYTGAIPVERSWRHHGTNLRRDVDYTGVVNIGRALDQGWVLTFPQGTTSPKAIGRIGAAKLVKKFKPIVVPLVFTGLERAFHPKGIRRIGKDISILLKIGKPLDIDYNLDAENILHQMMISIGEGDTPS